mgnify:CR=1 FL=1
MSKKKSYMNKSSILKENFLTDFFKKIFGKSNEKVVYKNFADNPKIAAKIKKSKALMKSIEQGMNKDGYVWNPARGGWIDKKTGKTAFED